MAGYPGMAFAILTMKVTRKTSECLNSELPGHAELPVACAAAERKVSGCEEEDRP